MPFKPVPPPKPKNYRPMVSSNGNPTNGNMPPNQWDTTVREKVIYFNQLKKMTFLFIFFLTGWFTQSERILLSTCSVSLSSTANTTTNFTATSDATWSWSAYTCLQSWILSIWQHGKVKYPPKTLLKFKY